MELNLEAGAGSLSAAGGALSIVVDQAVAWGADALFVSWIPGIGSPAPFYLANGFEETGEMDEDEVVARLALRRATHHG